MSTRADRYIRERFEKEIAAAYNWGVVVGAFFAALAFAFGAGCVVGACVA